MGRLLFFLILGFAIWWLLRKLRRGDAADQRGADAALAEAMPACALCGVHQPESECVRRGAAFYCSAEHAAEAARRQGGA